jgi:hypothetical protein
VRTIVITFFYNKAIEEGDENCHVVVFFSSQIEKKAKVASYRCLLRCNITTKENNNTLSSFSSFLTQKRKVRQ